MRSCSYEKPDNAGQTNGKTDILNNKKPQIWLKCFYDLMRCRLDASVQRNTLFRISASSVLTHGGHLLGSPQMKIQAGNWIFLNKVLQRENTTTGLDSKIQRKRRKSNLILVKISLDKILRERHPANTRFYENYDFTPLNGNTCVSQLYFVDFFFRNIAFV